MRIINTVLSCIFLLMAIVGYAGGKVLREKRKNDPAYQERIKERKREERRRQDEEREADAYLEGEGQPMDDDVRDSDTYAYGGHQDDGEDDGLDGYREDDARYSDDDYDEERDREPWE